MLSPCFDEAVTIELEGEELVLVIHRNAEGGIAYTHSPLDATKTLVCEICYSGARVMVR